ncbi:Urmylation protein [Pyricularia grisea]|nr:Urmylation protein [Pyricularia grisea]
MEEADKSAEELRAQIAECEATLQSLKEQLAAAEAAKTPPYSGSTETDRGSISSSWKWPLAEAEYDRYGRQLILPTVGIQGQLRLKAASVLIVGAGGLGCPASAYLAGAGVGTIGLVDGDTVEASNLHRQVAHGTSRVGMLKVDSAISYLRELNPLVKYNAHRTHLTPQNAESIVSGYDLVLDCTDHPTSRYLISDVCVLLRKPLVSASALRTDGQLIVLNTPAAPQTDSSGGPCYRCVFPRPPPPDAVTSCGEGGILGPVVGVMGVLQALEGIRLVAAGRHLLPPSEQQQQQQQPQQTLIPPSLLLFSAPPDGSPAGFRSVRMRGRRKDCFACGEKSTLSLATLREGGLDYVQFCGGPRQPVALLKPEERISAEQLNALLQQQQDGEHGKPVLLDVREREHFEIANIPGAINVPFSKTQSPGARKSTQENTKLDWLPDVVTDGDSPVYVVCRVGNDSQTVARQLKEFGLDNQGRRFVGDVKGGMLAWKKEVDSTLPFM